MTNHELHDTMEQPGRWHAQSGRLAAKLRSQLAALNQAKSARDLSAPSWRLQELKGDLRGYRSITVNGNWRIIFRFAATDVELVNYLDYP